MQARACHLPPSREPFVRPASNSNLDCTSSKKRATFGPPQTPIRAARRPERPSVDGDMPVHAAECRAERPGDDGGRHRDLDRADVDIARRAKPPPLNARGPASRPPSQPCGCGCHPDRALGYAPIALAHSLLICFRERSRGTQNPRRPWCRCPWATSRRG